MTQNDFARRHVACHHRAGADERARADANPAHDNRTRPESGSLPDSRVEKFPVGLGLELSAGGRRARILVVYENDTMADKYLIFDRHTAADKSVTLNLAPSTNNGPALNLHERADPCFVANLTSIEIRKRVDEDAGAEGDVVYQAVRRIICGPASHACRSRGY